MDDWIKHLKEVLGHPLARTIWNNVHFPYIGTSHGPEFFEERVVRTQYACVIKILLDPCFKKFQLSKINHKSVLIRFPTSEGNRDSPVVTMDERTVPVVPMLSV